VQLHADLGEERDLAAKADDPPPTPHYDSADEQNRLQQILERFYAVMLRAVNLLVAAHFDLDPDNFRVDDAATRRLLQTAASRVVRIDETTRQAIAASLQEGQARGYSDWQLANGVPADNFPGINGLFRETWKNRALTVARTELGVAQRTSALDRYLATGLVDRVRIIDGCLWDEECCRRNDTVVPIEQAPTLAHPNCGLVLTPVPRQGV
jgi:hypothetical protein